jgi:hypothetical protein
VQQECLQATFEVRNVVVEGLLLTTDCTSHGGGLAGSRTLLMCDIARIS